jgi:hypothetical protein
MPPAAGKSRLIYLIPFVVLGIFLGIFLLAVMPDSKEGEQVPPPRAPKLEMAGFDPGFIVSDEVFYDATTMNRDQIAEFVNEWNDGCREGADGAPCLADYTEDSPTWMADAFCAGDFVGEKGDSAAAIIDKAAQACQVNPQVLLTILQKEQGLITASGHGLNLDKYAIAMGYGCPDGGSCDPKYMGFARQVYSAAHQFQMYRLQPAMYEVIGGQTNNIAYNPDPDCGSLEIYVENQATAGLYNYTPYQPTEATLKGMPELCSSWGNMNFYGLFNAWFGPPRGE